MKTIEIYAKHSDLIDYSIYEDGKLLIEKEGESPYPLSICNSYDDLLIQIDLETGKILNWDKIKAKQLLENIKEEETEQIANKLLENMEVYDRQKEYDEQRPLREQRIKEDNEFYAIKYTESQKELLQYKDKFSKISLSNNTESIYKMSLSDKYNCIQFCLYRLLTASIELMKNNIPFSFNKENGLLIVNSSDAQKGREILTNLGAYEFNFCRRQNDIHSIIWNY